MNKVLGSVRGRRRAWIVAAALALVVASPAVFEGAPRAGVRRAAAALERVMLLGIGDSLMHGTMDATNNYVSSENGFLQKVADKLGEATRLRFKRPHLGLRRDPAAAVLHPHEPGRGRAPTRSRSRA